jgi:MFS transporter, DHA1 family, tetracycline resistance protein
LGALNPLRPLRRVLSVKRVLPIIVIFFIFSATGEAYGTCWALWGSDRFGVCQTLAQAVLPGRAVKQLGERAAVLTGFAGACVALIVMAFATQSWIFAIMPVFALGGIGVPALQSLAIGQVDESQQGQFQGVLASAVSLASIAGPLAFSSFYFVVREQWPGAIWLSVVVVYAISVPMVLGLHLKTPVAASAIESVGS